MAGKEKGMPSFELEIVEHPFGYEVIFRHSNKKPHLISNFVMRILYSIASEYGVKFILHLINDEGYEKTIYVTSDDFSTPGSLAKLINPHFHLECGSAELNAIKRTLFKDLKEASEISTLGFQAKHKVIAFSNAIIDRSGRVFNANESNGIVEYGDNVLFIPAASSLFEGDNRYFNERKFAYRPGCADFATWAKLQYQAYGYNGTFSLLFDVAAIFSDIVFLHSPGFVPYLFKFGPPNTAKSSHTELSLSLWGQGLKPISLEGASTEKGFSRKNAQLCNALVVYEEYTNTISDKMIGVLKTGYNRLGYERGNKTMDNSTTSSQVLSAIVIIGNELPTAKSALFGRVLLLEYLKGTAHDPFSDEEREAFENLSNLADEGLGNIVAEIFKNRELIETNYYKQYHHTKRFLKSLLSSYKVSVDERALGNNASILAIYELLCDKLEFYIDKDELYRTTVMNIKKQKDSQSRASETALFWSAFSNGIREKKLIEDTDYKISRSETRILYILRDRAYDVYAKYCRETGARRLDQETLIFLLKSSNAFIKQQEEHRDTSKQWFSELRQYKNAYAFNLDLLGIDIECTEQNDEFPAMASASKEKTLSNFESTQNKN